MRPIKLTVEGFTSFRSRQVIDFNELDLFAITGATGAGKSSLLDAITYAIYEKVPRLNVRDHGKELVSLGADNLKVEFQFAVRKQEYSVIRSWRYRRKNPEKKCLLYRLQNGTWEPCSLKVEEIVGMDFDTFTRVILLPQGHFDEFLKGNSVKRRIILRELAGFEIFEEMRKKASEREKEAKNSRQIIEASLNDLDPPTEDEIVQKREALIRLEQERIPQLQRQEKVAQTQLNSEDKLLELVNKLAETQKKLSVLVQNESQILTLTHRLEQAQKTDKIKDKWALVNQARTEYQKAQDAIKLAENKLSQAQKQFENTKLELREQLGKRLGVLEIQRREAERQYQEAEYLLTLTI
ncbi:AAA family ATPase [Capilliphycus salinus ALCB114379]|uniref:AAA family ATPase n=1 Tax=Capilliphycus salinus TaxID=2768948 RepID=UPI0039A70802